MILNNKRIFPYPVINYNNSDYKTSVFSLSLRVERFKSEIVLLISIFLNNPEIQNLIKVNKCKIIIHTECSKTSFREVFDYNQEIGENKIHIDSKKLNGNVQINACVVASEDIDDFNSNDFSDEFIGMSFFIESGTILAYEDTNYVFIEKNDQELLTIPSAVIIKSHSEKEDYRMKWDFNYERIYIYLNVEDYAKYRDSLGYEEDYPIFHRMIVYPAIVEAIRIIMSDYNNQYSHKRWFKAIKQRLLEEKIDLDNPKYKDETNSYLYAQTLLNFSLSRALSRMQTIREREEKNR